MNVLELLEGGGLLIVCVLISLFVIARNKASSGGWPTGILSTNFMVLVIIATGFFGIASAIGSFMS